MSYPRAVPWAVAILSPSGSWELLYTLSLMRMLSRLGLPTAAVITARSALHKEVFWVGRAFQRISSTQTLVRAVRLLYHPGRVFFLSHLILDHGD